MKTTEENNRMIAEFMGYEFNEEHEFYVDKGGNCSTIEELRFNNSWDWLMPVLKEISSILFSEFASSVADQWKMIESPTKYNIENVHEQAFQFIEWYNEQNHNHAGINP